MGAAPPASETVFEFGASHTDEYPKDEAVEVPKVKFRQGLARHVDKRTGHEPSLKNIIAFEEEVNKDKPQTLETIQLKEDPTLPARSHNNKPSKGAVIDKEILDDETEELKKLRAREALRSERKGEKE